MNILKKMIYIILTLILVAGVSIFLFMQQASFGKHPGEKRLSRMEKSPQYKNGQFENASETPMMSRESSYFKLLMMYINKKVKTEPDSIIPSVKRNWKEAPSEKPTITWFGHSSYLVQWNGKNILVDPVFSGRASPVSYAGSKSYAGSDICSVEDLPPIDVVIISHDHYDHLDYPTILQLKSSKFITALGVGAHLEYWGVPPDNISEYDWWETGSITKDIQVIAAPARHFSGRGFSRGKTLWASFVLITPDYRIYVGGDSGYDTHFKTIGDRFGPFDIALLECGQYNAFWPYIHMMPEQTVQAALDLRAKVLQPVHWGKFTLALHSWNEPIQRLVKEAEEKGLKICTPLIGEQVVIDSLYPNKAWW